MENLQLLYIDLFCGAGGTSTGVELAKHDDKQCAKVIACVNHDKTLLPVMQQIILMHSILRKTLGH